MNVENIVHMTSIPPPPRSRQHGHVSVLKQEVVDAIAPRNGEIYVDATLGLGGHTEALLEAAPNAIVVGIDRDLVALGRAEERLARFGDRVRFIHGRFSE